MASGKHTKPDPSPEQLTALELLITKRLCEVSFYDFVRQAWPLVEPDMEFRDNWHIQALCVHMQAVAEGAIKNLIINVPPGTMKSLLVSVFWPAWVWATRPAKRFMFASYSDAISMRDSVRCRTILSSTWFQSFWPLVMRDDQNTKGLFENMSGGWRLATSVSGKGTGLHPDFVCSDDPNNAKEAESDTERQNVIDWWDGTIGTRGISRDVAQIVIQQRLHTLDLTGYLLGKGRKDWDHICLPMEYEGPVEDPVTGERVPRMYTTSLGWQDPRKTEGELLWPSLFTEAKVARLKKNLGLYHAAGQLQQRPTPRGGGMFKRTWFPIVAVLPRCLSFVRYWDKAGTAGGDGARTAGVLMAKGEDGYYYVMDVKTARLGAAEREALIKQTAHLDGQRYGFGVRVWVEQEPGSGGKESAENSVKNLAGFSCQIERVTGSKEVRAEPFAAQASVGMVRLLAGEWNAQFLDEIENFPVGKLKDIVDASSGAINKLLVGTGAFGSGDEIAVPERTSTEPEFLNPEPVGQEVDFFA